jgi:AcrR family transcriptional regulator
VAHKWPTIRFRLLPPTPEATARVRDEVAAHLTVLSGYGRDVKKQVGRRPGNQQTRQTIVDAASKVFAIKGFRGATVRAIADAAGVDVSMIAHYFGTKQGLFLATLEFPNQAPERFLSTLSGAPDELGERLTRAYLEFWENPETQRQMIIAIKTALTHDEVMEHSRPVITDMIAKAVLTELPGPHPEQRFGFAMAHLLGVAIARYVSKVPPLAEMDLDEVIVHTAPAIQLHLTGD